MIIKEQNKIKNIYAGNDIEKIYTGGGEIVFEKNSIFYLYFYVAYEYPDVNGLNVNDVPIDEGEGGIETINTTRVYKCIIKDNNIILLEEDYFLPYIDPKYIPNIIQADFDILVRHNDNHGTWVYEDYYCAKRKYLNYDN